MRPTVSVGKPSDTDKYDALPVDGLTVYVQKGLNVSPEGIEIVGRKVGLFKWLGVKGVLT